MPARRWVYVVRWSIEGTEGEAMSIHRTRDHANRLILRLANSTAGVSATLSTHELEG